MNIYIYDGPFEKGEKGHYLIRKAIGLYCIEKGINFEPEDLEIIKNEKGKPYLKNSQNMGGIEFSLSHSDGLWMCLVGEDSCGIDVQYDKPCSFEEISKKYFSAAEQHYVELWGREGFFDLWVRHEAFGKTTGEGFLGERPQLVSETYDLLDQVEFGGKTYYIHGLAISDDIKCAFCSLSDGSVEIRSL